MNLLRRRWRDRFGSEPLVIMGVSFAEDAWELQIVIELHVAAKRDMAEMPVSPRFPIRYFGVEVLPDDAVIAASVLAKRSLEKIPRHLTRQWFDPTGIPS